MKIVFVSNWYNHHQSSVSEALYKLTNSDFCFIETAPMSQERKTLGWGEFNLPSFVKQSYGNKTKYDQCIRIINEADIVISGSAPNEMLKERLKEKKIVLRYSERIYKSVKNILTLPARFFKYHTYNFGSDNVFLLCASAYAANDYAKTGNYIKKTYKWGYYPKTVKYQNIQALIDSKEHNSIIWVARFIDWKHPEVPVKVAKVLKNEGFHFIIKMIGNGAMEEQIKSLAVSEGVDDCVLFLGAMKPDDVRRNMEKSEIFLMTSDRNEGWGAVLNEAMNSACAVVVNKSIGAVPFLVKDRHNGLIYSSEKHINEICDHIKSLLNDKSFRINLSKQAYATIVDLWNADIAAERLVVFCYELLKGKTTCYEDGPLSMA